MAGEPGRFAKSPMRAGGPSASWLVTCSPFRLSSPGIRRPIRQATPPARRTPRQGHPSSGAHRVGLDRPPPLNRRSAEHDLPGDLRGGDPARPGEKRDRTEGISHGLGERRAPERGLPSVPDRWIARRARAAARDPRDLDGDRSTIARYISARPVQRQPGDRPQARSVPAGASPAKGDRPPAPGGSEAASRSSSLAAAQQAADPSQRTARRAGPIQRPAIRRAQVRRSPQDPRPAPEVAPPAFAAKATTAVLRPRSRHRRDADTPARTGQGTSRYFRRAPARPEGDAEPVRSRRRQRSGH